MKKIGILLIALGTLCAPSHAQQASVPAPPLSYRNWQQLKDKPGAIPQLTVGLPPVSTEGKPAPPPPLRALTELQKLTPPAALSLLKGSNELRLMRQNEVVERLSPSVFAPEAIPAQLWSNLANTPAGGSYNLGNPLLLTDGTVIVHRTDTTEWYKLTPDNKGSYVNGTWSQIASMPPNYAPKFFASAVLPDGRVIAEGGEYNFGDAVWTTLGAIYDPTAGAGGSWKAVTPSAGWATIGDGQSAVLANGAFVLADCCGGPPFRAAILNLANLTWTATGLNKADKYDEEGWTLLPDGSLLTVDAYTTAIAGSTCGTNTEIFTASTGSWSSAGNVPAQLADCNPANADGGKATFEMGPHVMMYNGKIIAFGGNTANTAHTALYDTATRKWTAGPDLPSTCGSSANLPCTMADAPATLLPNGRVLFVASAGAFKVPANFFEYDPVSNSITAVPGTSDASTITSFYTNFLILPTGQILTVETYTPTIQIYSASGTVQDSLWPVVTSISSTNCVAPGSSYVLNGRQLNGLAQGASYGDDQQSATNYPLVRIVNNSSGNVFYARTSGHSTMTTAPNAPGSTNFSVSSSTETGASMLYVVANGIASTGSPINVSSTCPTSNE